MLRTLQTRVVGSLRSQWSRAVSNTVADSPDVDEGRVETDPRKRNERCLNRVTLIGRVGREPEQRGTAEHPCLIFPLATNAVYRRADGERIVKTDWHRVAVFKPGLRDSVASRVNKGDRLFVEGSISYMRYNDNSTVVSINADTVMFLNKRLGGQNPASDDEAE